MRKLILATGAVAVLAAAWSLTARAEPNQPTTSPSSKSSQQVGLATITYDTGTFDTVPTVPGEGSTYFPAYFAFGNRFVLADVFMETASYSITGISAWLAVVNGSTSGTGDIYVTRFSAPLGSYAFPADTAELTGVQAGTFNQLPIAGFTGLSGPEVILGIYNPDSADSYDSAPCANDCVGMDAGTVNGFGHHAFRATAWLGAYADIPGYNAMLRLNVGGTLPVELMSFTVE